jgi:nucleoid-associated protein YgaU
VPDRPTEGAPTRYTDLRSGREIKTTKIGRRVVRPGDSLWALAAAELGPHATDPAVAARWPQWYAANRGVIGPDPDLILPGQVLRIPGHIAGQPVPPTDQEK